MKESKKITPAELKVLVLAEEDVQRILRRQIMEQKHEHYGGIIKSDTGLPSAVNHGGVPADLVTLITVYLHPHSLYYQDSQLIPHMEAAVEFMLRSQRRAGLISMDVCNFDSPPDTGFVVVGLAELYTFINESEQSLLVNVRDRLKGFLRATIPGLVHGGVHTPNHRWVVAAALMWLYEIFGEEAAKTRALQWLDEGIDCSDEGEWTELSNGVYNVICDIMFFQLASLLKDEALLEPVRRNLKYISHMIHPNGLLVTDFSTRQDRLVKHHVDTYYLIYALMAGHDCSGEWASLADLALENMGQYDAKGFSACTHELLYHLRYPHLMNLTDLTRKPAPQSYERCIRKVSTGFSIIRRRDDRASLTLTGGLDTIGSFLYGDARLASIRPTLGFFGKAVVRLPEWKVLSNGSYQATTTIAAPYFGPLSPAEMEVLSDHVDLLDMYNSHREEIDVCDVTTQFTLTPVIDGFDLQWTTSAMWPVYSQMALMFGEEGVFQEDLGLRRLNPNEYLLESDLALYRCGRWVIEVKQKSPLKPQHQLPAIRGDVPRPPTHNLLVNSLSSTEVVLEIRGYQSGMRRNR